MSISALIIGVLLLGQAAADDRYSSPFDNPSATEGDPVFRGSTAPSGYGTQDARNNDPDDQQADGSYAMPRSNRGAGVGQAADNSGRQSSVSPPPNSRSAPTTTAQDYGLEANSSNDAASMAPAAMMRAMLSAPGTSNLVGIETRLGDAVSSGSTRQQQSQCIDAYWDLCSSVADYYLGLREQDELQRLRTVLPGSGAAWREAESELGVRVGTAQRAAVASQYKLGSLIGRNDPATLPLPKSVPHCGDYYARYDQIFVGRPSLEAEQLSELLPLRYEELKDAAAAVTRAEEWLDAVAAQRNASADETGVLRALELLALRRRAFVQIVRDYNRRIARYSELAAPGQIESDRLIGMLIKREDTANTATRNSAAPPPNRQSLDTPRIPPTTFTKDWAPAGSSQSAAARRDEAVQPAAAEAEKPPRREHSLLVPSR